MDRREFLLYAGGAAFGGLVARSTWFVDVAEAASERDGSPVRGRGPVPSLTTVLRRREDFLTLRYEFYNLRLDVSGPEPRLVRQNPNGAAHVVVVFPTQSVVEQAFFEQDTNTEVVDPPPGQTNPDPSAGEPLASPPVGARVGGESRLAYLVPESVTAIPYTAEALLDWNAWGLQVPPSALLPGGGRVGTGVPELRAPTALETAIELPWWLLIAPHSQAAWAHAIAPVTRNGRTELWHTRLGVADDHGGVDEAHEALRTMRAIWTRDPGFADYLDEQGGAGTTPFDGEDFPKPSGVGLPFRSRCRPVTATTSSHRAPTSISASTSPATSREPSTSTGSCSRRSAADSTRPASGRSTTAPQPAGRRPRLAGHRSASRSP